MGEAGTSPSSSQHGLRFPATRRLKHRRLIEPLFDRANPTSHSVKSGVVRIVYRFVSADQIPAPFQVGVAVGRSLGHAPKRNRIKRVLREGLRHQQARLERIADSSERSLTAMVLFQGASESASRIRSDLDKALERLESRVAAADD